jgi:hypothetical protein
MPFCSALLPPSPVPLRASRCSEIARRCNDASQTSVAESGLHFVRGYNHGHVSRSISKLVGDPFGPNNPPPNSVVWFPRDFVQHCLATSCAADATDSWRD